MATISILGGGISGLSTAFYLLNQGKRVINKIILLEATNRVGGWIQSKRFPDGAVYEVGPRSLRTAGNVGLNTLDMIEDLDLDAELVAIRHDHPVSKNRLLVVNNEMHILPSGISAAFKRVPPFSLPTFVYAMRDLMRSREILEDDTMYKFAERRFGREIAELVMDPLCRGVYAGDAKQISVKALLGTAFEAEQKYGSVIYGLINSRVRANKNIETHSKLCTTARMDRWALCSFQGGLETLVIALSKRVEELGAEIRINSRCKRLHFTDKTGVKVETTTGDFIDCDHVFAALPSHELSSILLPKHTGLVDELQNIPTVSVGVVTLEYNGSPKDLLQIQGFGFLLPSCQEPEVLGVIYDSCCFPELDSTAAQTTTRFTAMMGGSWFEQYFGNPDEIDKNVLLIKAIETVGRYLGIKSDPVRHMVTINKNCIPQYGMGHSERVRRMERYIATTELPISLVGNSYHGVGVNDCIAGAKLKVTEFIAAR